MNATATSLERYKITPPALAGTIPRRALIERIGALTTPGKWLCAPSGSGKSTLVAAYVQQAKRPAAWYRLDARDDDPAFFFSTFGAALRAQLKGVPILPHFSAADRGNEDAFAARFFGAALGRNAAPLTIVVDDLQKASAEWLAAALARLVQSPLPDCESVFLSETPPPPPFFDAIVARRLSLANDVDLRFSVDECNAVAQSLRLPATRGDEVMAVTGGHAGAVILACEFMRGTRGARAPTEAATRQMHAHLLGKLVEQLPAEQRDLLLRAANLPRLAAPLVDRLLGRSDAAALLEALADRGLLIRFPADDEVAFEPHGLVRAGALALAEKVLGREEARRNRVRCAELLQANEQLEDAFGLWIQLEQIDSALAVLESLSQRYARQQQAQLLLRAIERVSLDDVRRRPWIAFWAGQAMLGVDEEQARRWFDIAYAGFERDAERPGMALAAASVLIAFNTDLDEASTVPLWLARFRATRGVLKDAAPMPWRAIVLLGVVSEASLADAADTSEDDAKDAVQELVRLVNDADAWPSRDQQLEAAAVLIDHVRLLDSRDFARQIALATEPLARDEAASPLMRGRWWLALMRTHHDDGEQERVEFCLQQVDRLIDVSGVKALAFEVTDYRTNDALRAHDLERAADGMARLEALAAGGTQVQIANVGRAAARLLLLQGKPKEALARAETAYRTALNAGYSRSLALVYEVEIAYAAAGVGEFEAAAQRLHEVALLQSGVQRVLMSSFAYCYEYFAGGENDRQALTLGLQLAARASFLRLLGPLPQLAARLCERALAYGIEVEFVRAAIEHQRLLPPIGAGPAWPWRIRIWTLGGFRLEIAGEIYKPQYKAQDKPLELLKLLIAATTENRLQPEKGWLAERLWPDADDGSARKSLDMTVARLRRLLDCDEAIVVSEGRVQLSDEHVWSDVRHLLTAIGRVIALRDAGMPEGRPNVPVADLDPLVSSYGGEFLRGDEETTWLLGARLNLSRNFRAALLAAETALSADDDGRFIAVLERALGAEPIAEDLARALMRCYQRRREFSAALAVYRRLRDMLSIVLNVAPAAQTEELRQQIYRAAEADAAANAAPPAKAGAGR